MKCSKCGIENAITAVFCANCGDELNKKLIRVCSNNKYRYIDLHGNTVIGPYNNLTPYYGKYTFCEHGVYDKQGNIVKNGNTCFFKHYNVVSFNGDLLDLSLNSIIPETMSVETDGYIITYIDAYQNVRSGYTFEGDNGEYISEETPVIEGKPEHETHGILGPNGSIIYSVPLIEKFKYETTYNMSVGDGDNFYIPISVNDKYAIINGLTGKVVYDFIDNKIEWKTPNIFCIPDKQLNIYITSDKVVYEATESIEKGIDGVYYIEKDGKEVFFFKDGSMAKIDDFTDAQKMEYAEIASKHRTYNYSFLKAFDMIAEYKKETEINKLNLKKYVELGYKIFFSPEDPENPFRTRMGLKYNDKVIIDCTKYSINYLDMETYSKLEKVGKTYVLADDSIIDIKTGEEVKKFVSSKWQSFTTFLRCIVNDGEEPVLYDMLTDKTIPIKREDKVCILDNYIIVTHEDKWLYYNLDCELIFEGDIIPEEKEHIEKEIEEKEARLLGVSNTTTAPKAKSFSEIKSELDTDLKDNSIYQGIKKIFGFFKKDK